MYRCLLLPVVLGLLLATVVPVGAQVRNEATLERIQSAFTNGDAKALLGHAASRMEIAILGESKFYSRAQAMYVLQDFFARYQPQRFVFRDYVKKGRGWFVKGDYWYARGRHPLRVYMRLWLRGGQWEVREILIEEPSDK